MLIILIIKILLCKIGMKGVLGTTGMKAITMLVFMEINAMMISGVGGIFRGMGITMGMGIMVDGATVEGGKMGC